MPTNDAILNRAIWNTTVVHYRNPGTGKLAHKIPATQHVVESTGKWPEVTCSKCLAGRNKADKVAVPKAAPVAKPWDGARFYEICDIIRIRYGSEQDFNAHDIMDLCGDDLDLAKGFIKRAGFEKGEQRGHYRIQPKAN